MLICLIFYEHLNAVSSTAAMYYANILVQICYKMCGSYKHNSFLLEHYWIEKFF